MLVLLEEASKPSSTISSGRTQSTFRGRRLVEVEGVVVAVVSAEALLVTETKGDELKDDSDKLLGVDKIPVSSGELVTKLVVCHDEL